MADKIRLSMRLAALLACLMSVAGCSTATDMRRFGGREPSPDELRTLTQAVRPLFEELELPVGRPPDNCRVGLTIISTMAINAGAAPGTRSPCTVFMLGLSEGAVRRLPVDMLRAIVAHELGHVQLGHFQIRRARADVPALFTRAFNRAEEEEADRFAVALLRKIEPRYPGACIALVYVLSILSEQPAGPSRWLATHPSPDRRAESVRNGCTSSPGPSS